MQVVDHQPHAWFLLRENEALFLDVNCDHGAVGYSVMIELTADETSGYADRGRAFLDELARDVQDAGPSHGYRRRDVSADHAKAATAAIDAWREHRESG